MSDEYPEEGTRTGRLRGGHRVGLSVATAATPRPLVGPGCSGYAAQVPTGPGSVTGMAQDPVAVAASNNPLLTTLTAAVSGKLNPDVNLVDTLNGGRVHRVRADRRGVRQDRPGDDRHAEDRRAVLTKILTYHVVPGRPAPSQVVGTHKTVQGGTVTVTGGATTSRSTTRRWSAAASNRQRDGLHDRHGADAPSQLDSGTTEYARSPAVVVGLQAFRSRAVSRRRIDRRLDLQDQVVAHRQHQHREKPTFGEREQHRLPDRSGDQRGAVAEVAQ